MQFSFLIRRVVVNWGCVQRISAEKKQKMINTVLGYDEPHSVGSISSL